MRSRKKLLRNSRLYLVFDIKALGKRGIPGFFSGIRDLRGLIIQLRDKSGLKKRILRQALLLRRIIPAGTALFIVNDYLDIAKISDADGVHLGQDDTSVAGARRILGTDKLIGVSCHSLGQALSAQKQGADYVGIGPIFHTTTKPEYRPVGLELLAGCRKKLRIPFFAIGNICRDNLKDVIAAQAERVAVCGAIMRSRNINETINQIHSRIRSNSA